MKNSVHGELVEPCELCELRASAVRFLFFFGCGATALGPLWLISELVPGLRRDFAFVVNTLTRILCQAG